MYESDWSDVYKPDKIVDHQLREFLPYKMLLREERIL